MDSILDVFSQKFRHKFGHEPNLNQLRFLVQFELASREERFIKDELCGRVREDLEAVLEAIRYKDAPEVDPTPELTPEQIEEIDQALNLTAAKDATDDQQTKDTVSGQKSFTGQDRPNKGARKKR